MNASSIAPSRREFFRMGGLAIGAISPLGLSLSEVLANETEVPFLEAVNHFEANAQRDGLVECHGQLRTIA
ncbi:MAG: hypothetical protein QGH11_13165, partial [Pirellulaceae bacterium]|nr:hypothetical protein [Pirellulaceae bacterium]